MDWVRPALKQDDLELIAKQTGGRVFYVSASPELDVAYARIGDELRSQYVLAFATPKPLTEEELGSSTSGCTAAEHHGAGRWCRGVGQDPLN
jgi:hypothetical protein